MSQLKRFLILKQNFKLSYRCYWYRKQYQPEIIEPGRYPYPKKQVPECGTKTIEERLKEMSTEFKDSVKVDIGLPSRENWKSTKRFVKNVQLEPSARKRTLAVPIDEVHLPHKDTAGPRRRQYAAEHYGIFKDLYGPPHYFVPSINFGIKYPFVTESDNAVENDGETNADSIPFVQPVYTGNLISSNVTMNYPFIDLSWVPKDYLWTLVMTCPDEPVQRENNLTAPNEYIHWMISNMNPEKSDEMNYMGDIIVPYMPALPYQGTGYHRYVFVLYRQDTGRIDLSQYAVKGDVKCSNLNTDRGFSTLDFYRSLQSDLTPGGLLFFQSIWDSSVRFYYRNVLDIDEPVFEITWPDPKLPPQEEHPEPNWWVRPRRHPQGIPLVNYRFGAHNDVSFDTYLDRYRDRKEMFEEIVRHRLKAEGNPLDVNEVRRKSYEYPAAVPMPRDEPSWWRKQEYERRVRMGRWKHLEGHDG